MIKTLLIANLISMICVIIAGVLVYNHIEGWGWFLFVAVLAGHGIRSRDGKEEIDNNKVD